MQGLNTYKIQNKTPVNMPSWVVKEVLKNLLLQSTHSQDGNMNEFLNHKIKGSQMK